MPRPKTDRIRTTIHFERGSIETADELALEWNVTTAEIMRAACVLGLQPKDRSRLMRTVVTPEVTQVWTPQRITLMARANGSPHATTKVLSGGTFAVSNAPANRTVNAFKSAGLKVVLGGGILLVSPKEEAAA